MTLSGAISSPDNQHLRAARALHQKRARYRRRQYLVEGLRSVDQALRAGVQPVSAFYTEELLADPRGCDLIARLERAASSTWRVPAALLVAVADTVTPQGIVAVVPMPDPSPTVLGAATLLLALDGIRDPGNLGTMLRTAQATAVDGVLLGTGCADPYAPKTVRGGMGAQLTLPLFPGLDWSTIASLTAHTRRVLAEVDALRTVWEHDWRVPTTLIVGGEAFGAGDAARTLAEVTVSLPMAPGVESLNAAVAAAAILFEVRRQRGPVS